jgi:hypothetical protein
VKLKTTYPLLNLLIGFQPSLTFAQTVSADKSTKTRFTAERPTALPEDRNLANKFAWAAAGYTTQVRILQAAGQDTAKLLSRANWLYFNAIDLSDEKFAKAQFTLHMKELSALNEDVNKAFASQQKDQLSSAAHVLMTHLNERLSEGDRLFEKYGKVFNTVIQHPDGLFTIEAQR